MIEEFAHALRSVGITADAVELAEILWLATHQTWEPTPAIHRDGTPGDTPIDTPQPAVSQVEPVDTETTSEPAMYLVPAQAEAGGVVEVRLPAPIALPDRLRLARALRGFKRRYPTSRFSELDLDATITFYGETGLFVPLQRQGSERWFDVTLVVDAGPTMDVWAQTATEFARMLAGHGAFRRVRRVHLADDDGRPCLRTEHGTCVDPRRVAGHSSRHLIIVISDCVGVPWYRDDLWQVIRDWCGRGPMVILETLPPRLWASTALGPVDAQVGSRRPGQPTNGLRIIQPWWSIADRNESSRAVPVVGLTEAGLARWARMVMGSADVLVPAVFIEADRDEPLAPSALSADERIATFKATVSVEAYQLAVCLAAVPIRLPIARIVQYAVVGSRDPVHLAEVFASGLISRETPVGADISPDDVVYEFRPGVRELLQRSLTGSRTLEILRAVALYLDETRGASTSFTALLSENVGQAEIDATVVPFAEVSQPLLRRLGISALPNVSRRPARAAEQRPVPEQPTASVIGVGADHEPPEVFDDDDTTSISGALANLPEYLRIRTLAKLLGRSSREVLDALEDLGAPAFSPQSRIDRETALRVGEELVANDTAHERGTDGDPARSGQPPKYAGKASRRTVLLAQTGDLPLAGSQISRFRTGFAVSRRLILTSAQNVRDIAAGTLRARIASGLITASDWIDSTKILWIDDVLNAAILQATDDLADLDSEPLSWVTVSERRPLSSCVLISAIPPVIANDILKDGQFRGTLYPQAKRYTFESADLPTSRSIRLALSGAPVLRGDNLIGVATVIYPTSWRIRVTPISSLMSDRGFARITSPYLRQSSVDDVTFTENRIYSMEDPSAPSIAAIEAASHATQLSFDLRRRLESERPLRVFISYSHENPAHRNQVIRFATVLREDLGIDARLDAWYEGNRQDWSRWVLEQLDEADFVLAIASPTFRDQVDGRRDPAERRGVRFEGALLREWITRNQPDWVRRILPIVLPGNAVADIPQLLLPYAATHYVVREVTPAGLLEIHRALAGDGIPRLPLRGAYRVPPLDDPVRPISGESVLLTSLPPAERGSDVRFRAAEINGHHYGDSVVYRPDLFANEPRGAVEFVIGRKFRQFEAMAGVLDDARDGRQTGHFQLFLDGHLTARGTATLGKPVRFRVDVTGVFRVRLVAYRADTVANPMMVGTLMTGGKSGNMPELAWGDPTVTS